MIQYKYYVNAVGQIKARGFTISKMLSDAEFTKKYSEKIDCYVTDDAAAYGIYMTTDKNVKKDLFLKILERAFRDCEIIGIYFDGTIKKTNLANEALYPDKEIRHLNLSALSFNYPSHDYIPRCEVIRDAEKVAAMTKEWDLPRILSTDPMCSFYGAKIGNIVKVYREYNKNGNMDLTNRINVRELESIIYRLVIPATYD